MPNQYLGKRVESLVNYKHIIWGDICRIGSTGKVIEHPYCGEPDYALVEWDTPMKVNTFPMKVDTEIEVRNA